MFFIELHKEEDGKRVMIHINNVTDIYEHSEVGCIIGFADGDNFQHVSETYEEIAKILQPHRKQE